MYEKKFTPGPWLVDEDGDVSAFGHDKFGNQITRMVCEIEPISVGDMDYNAHLISAAPELLDALIAVLEWAEDNGMAYFLYDRCKSSVNKSLNIKNDEL